MKAEVVRHATRGSLPTRAVRVPFSGGGNREIARVEVVEPAMEVVEAHERRAHQQMAIDQHARVALGLAEREDLLADLGGLVELRAEQVQAGEAAQHGELQPDVDAALEPLEGAGEGGLDLGREALGRHQRPGERRPERDLLVDPLGRGGTASRTASMSDASPTVSRYQPCASSRISSALASLSSCSKSPASTQ